MYILCKYSKAYLSRLKPLYQQIFFSLSFYLIVDFTVTTHHVPLKYHHSNNTREPCKNSKRSFSFIACALWQLNSWIIFYFNINLTYRANLYPIVASIIFLLTNMDNDSYTKRQRDNVQEMLDYRFFEKRMRGYF